VQQGGEERPISRGEPDLPAVQLPFDDCDLMAQCEDLGVLSPVAHRQKAKHRERVGHAEIRQSKQHEAASSPSG